MVSIESPHTLTPVQYAVLTDVRKMIMYSGGYGCGKTLMGCYWAILNALHYPGSTGSIMSPTVKMLNDNIIQPHLIDILNILVTPYDYRFPKSKEDFSIYLFNGSVIRLRAFDDEGKIRGADLNWIWLDEAIGKDQLYLSKIKFQQITARLRRGDPLQFLITTNPASKSHFLYKYFVEDQDDEKSIIYGSIYENKHLPSRYVRQMEKTFTKEELMGKWVRNVGVVYAEFDRELHVSTEIKETGLDYYLAVDFGLDNPFACILIGVDYDDTIHVIDEVYGGMLTIVAVPLIQDMIGNRTIHTIVCDNNAYDGANELEESLGVNVQRVKFKHKMVNMGIRMVKKYLRLKPDNTPRLIISDKCVNLINEFESYILDRDKDEYGRDRPIKKNDHALDALRYFTTYHNM